MIRSEGSAEVAPLGCRPPLAFGDRGHRKRLGTYLKCICPTRAHLCNLERNTMAPSLLLVLVTLSAARGFVVPSAPSTAAVGRAAVQMNTQYTNLKTIGFKKDKKTGDSLALKGYTVGSRAPEGKPLQRHQGTVWLRYRKLVRQQDGRWQPEEQGRGHQRQD